MHTPSLQPATVLLSFSINIPIFSVLHVFSVVYKELHNNNYYDVRNLPHRDCLNSAIRPLPPRSVDARREWHDSLIARKPLATVVSLGNLRDEATTALLHVSKAPQT